ncbi:MAG: carboxypeptidase-like regulatory domain-containing protein [Gemmatales bacterium]|nr:carboxypeptidase-like regulatory domain-containing protein [Gemmatales bacterium]MDW7995814.1 carboxypeptidase-like regulatory domain-containing protein [Gemmatales bacterium]
MLALWLGGWTWVCWVTAAQEPALTGLVTGELRRSEKPDDYWDGDLRRRPELNWVLLRLFDQRGRIVAQERTYPDGTFQFRGLPAGDYELEACRPGYLSQRQKVKIPGSARFELLRDPDYDLLVLPRTLRACFALPGNELDVLCRGSDQAQGWEVSLSNDYITRRCEILEARRDGQLFCDQKWEAGWHLRVRIPKDLPPDDMYHLTVQVHDAGRLRRAMQYKAVKLLRDWPTAFWILGFQDFHLDHKTFELDGTTSATNESLGRGLFWQAGAYLNAAWISINDDIGLIEYPKEGNGHAQLWHLIVRYGNTPSYFTFGGPHDYEGPEMRRHRYHFGPRCYRITFGPQTRILGVMDYCPNPQNCFTEDIRTWLRREVQQVHQDAAVRLVFLQANVSGHLAQRGEFLIPPEQWPPLRNGWQLAEHFSYDGQGADRLGAKSWSRIEPPVYRLDYERLFLTGQFFWIGRVSQSNVHGWDGLLRTPVDLAHVVQPQGTTRGQLTGYRGVMLPFAQVRQPNEREAVIEMRLSWFSPKEARCTVTDDFPRVLPAWSDGRLRLVLPRDEYSVENAEILHQATSDNGHWTLLYLRLPTCTQQQPHQTARIRPRQP